MHAYTSAFARPLRGQTRILKALELQAYLTLNAAQEERQPYKFGIAETLYKDKALSLGRGNPEIRQPNKHRPLDTDISRACI